MALLTMRKHHSLFLLILLAAFLPSIARKRKSASGTDRSARVLNESEVKIDVFWIHATTRAVESSQTEGKGIFFGSDTGISSYIGHSFEIQELPNEKTKKCVRKTCRKAYFTVSSNEDQWFTVTPDFFVKIEDHKTRALEKAKEALKLCEADTSLPVAEQFEQMATCLEKQVNSTLETSQEEINFQAETRQEMGELLVGYACLDTELNTTVTVQNRTWTYKNPAQSTGAGRLKHKSVHRMKILFDSENSSVQLVENFVTPAECQAIQEASVPSKDDADKLLLPSTAKGSAEIKSVLAKISSLIESSLGLEVDYDSRDTLLEVYTQQKSTDSEQQCTAESKESGACVSSDDAASGEITVTAIEDDISALLLIFCGAPAKGGAIHFPRTGVHVNSAESEGEALLMIYTDPATGKRDQNGFISEYVACPVQEGTMMAVVDSFPSA